MGVVWTDYAPVLGCCKAPDMGSTLNWADNDMTRRRFRSALFLALLAIPFATGAQSVDRVYRIGWLGVAPFEEQAAVRPGALVLWNSFIRGLRAYGWVEGKNIVFEHRWSRGETARYPQLAAELVASKPDVIATGLGEPAVRALQAATTTIPIVMAVSADPVGTGLVASLGRPGGNVTGVSILAPDVGGKRLELLREALPKLSRVAVLWNAAYPGKAAEYEVTQRAALALGIELHPVTVRAASDLDAAFGEIIRAQPQAVVVMSDPLTLQHQQRIVEFATKHRLPFISETSEFAEAGGLMTYGASLSALFHRAAYYVDRVLRGAPPASLPIEQPTRFDLVINVRTAKALQLTIPTSVLTRADLVIK